jgi:heparin binding hemagglutinin HbhA
MAFPVSIEKTRKDIESTLTDPTPLYAVVGIADAAAAKLRSARAELGARAAAVQSDVKATPAQVWTLPSRAQALLDDAVTGALSTYSGLAGRGKTVVTRVRSQEASVELEHQAKATNAKVKAATTTAKKSTAATRKSAKSATTTTRKSVAATKTAAKSAATSSKRTTSAAAKAAEATAAKLGD